MTRGELVGGDRFYNELAKYYDFICGDRKKEVALLRRLIKKHKRTQGNKLLDVACGTGLEDKYLKEDFRLTGIDLNEGVLNIARRRNPEIDYTIGDMRNFRLDEKFDVLICLDAMSHLRNYKDMKTTLRNFSNHLVQRGIFIFLIDPNFLKEHSGQDNILVTQKTKGGMSVILFEIYHRAADKVEGHAIYLIREAGKSRVEVMKSFEGLFEVRRIKQIISELGLKTYLYRGDLKLAFSTTEYTRGSPFPVFVCEKGGD